MTIEEEIKVLENALSGALLVPSECAFVDTQVIKICLDILKNYESWENLIRYEIGKQIRADAIEEVINNCSKEYQASSDDTVCKIWLSKLEQLKEQK